MCPQPLNPNLLAASLVSFVCTIICLLWTRVFVGGCLTIRPCDWNGREGMGMGLIARWPHIVRNAGIAVCAAVAAE